ncbi:hypothetical protein [Methylorubrum extorquens]|uniref:Uncharacterized protein n=1 Tax=Methylorubrum extorquens (strain ATCC 14718 / DSM 1338 / JCM 2805 / NCIMB 9133 / AM1) TaxID=272630 RepID=C5AT48_METEA|nr:hypothetical protein [Methylorubrum extorquens]ACS38358.1 conserved hypothetical protein [Methylorubrum extorquens AM1]MCP1543583.1 hypothetical protein [Methylorubrum extorquens]MCP1589072.1 hypothetical protein [Methylorubrum extorquens]
MRRALIILGGLVLAVPGTARAEPGSFFKNMFGGREGDAPAVTAPRAQDPDGSVAVRVGVELRALLGPAGASGRFEVPVSIGVKFNEQPVMMRSHRVAVAVPAGAAQGEATVIENDLTVPADKAMGYDIEVTLAGASARPKPAVRRRKPAPAAAAEQGEAPVAQ